MKTFLKNVREFYAAQKRLPNNIRELEVKIWNKNNPGKASVLQYADNIWVSENYEYIYFTGMVGGVGQANVWAVPMGKYRDEAETVLMVIAPDGEDIWRGPALTEDQLASVLAKGFNPGLAQMSLLNMSKDQPVKVKEQSTKKFGIF